jgi:hypothetical protein
MTAYNANEGHAWRKAARLKAVVITGREGPTRGIDPKIRGRGASGAMFAFLAKLLLAARSRQKSRARLEAENVVLRQQVIVLSRKSHSRVRAPEHRSADFRLAVPILPVDSDAIVIVKPETVIRWHRRGFRAYWRWKSRRRGGRPRIHGEIRDLIRRMGRDNPLWGAPRIHAELLMLGIEVAESTVGRYLPRRGAATIPRLEDFPLQSRCQNRVDRSVRRAHDILQATLWFSDSASRSTAAGYYKRDFQSDRRVDCGSGH